MADSRNLAALMGPSMIAITATEALNVGIFAHTSAHVVYLNGTILFVAGFAVIRAHNLWSWRWPVVVTLVGWLMLALGLFRMIAPQVQMAVAELSAKIGIAVVLAAGCFLTWKAYGLNRSPE